MLYYGTVVIREYNTVSLFVASCVYTVGCEEVHCSIIYFANPRISEKLQKYINLWPQTTLRCGGPQISSITSLHEFAALR